MTNSEPRSLFELSQKRRPRDADRFEKNVSRLEKPRNIAQKRRYREHEFGAFAEPIAIRSTRTDFQQFELAPPLSITIPCVCLSGERKRAIDDYRHLLQTMSLIISCIVFALIITINISCTGSRRQKARVLRFHYLE